jgi:hypothetical protein
MPDILLGPLLRHVAQDEATVWLETDAACEVEILGVRSETFCVAGHHYALVEIAGLQPACEVPYTVTLDGEQRWPEADSAFPPSLIRTLHDDHTVRIVFGSCRVTLPHEPPYVLHQDEDERAHGVDALRTLALRMAASEPEHWPHCLLMLGDQIYADELSPAMQEVTARRPAGSTAPEGELSTFEEYALAYREAWCEPVIRWLLSTTPSAMVFDDHEMHAQWKLSRDWEADQREEPWYQERVEAGLMAYWLYQHIGNLAPADLRDHPLLEQVRSESDAGELLRREMCDADRQPGHSRWSYVRDLAGTRLVVIDSRAGRVLDRGERQLIDAGEWEWVTDAATGDFDHVVLASSVPVLLAEGLHHVEAATEVLADGAHGRLAARAAEKARQSGVMDHWASFGRSFGHMSELLGELAAGRGGHEPPASVVMLSGDVHHCYLAQVGFRAQVGARAPVWQAVCSAYRKELAPREKRVMRLGNSRLGGLIARRIARAVGVPAPSIGWRMIHDPSYDNQVATLELAPGAAHLRVETSADADWRAPELREVFTHRLAGDGEPDAEGAAAGDATARPMAGSGSAA